MGLLGLDGADRPAVILPGIRVSASDLAPCLPMSVQATARLVRTVVDTHLHLPDMFELTFLDDDGDILDTARLSIGCAVEIYGTKSSPTDSTLLIKAEVTAVEAICRNAQIFTLVRGYEKAHRLQRARRTRTFLDMKDSDVARKIASEAGLQVGGIDASKTRHAHISQVDQTDWEFLNERAREIGFETGVTEGKFFFRRASGLRSGGLGALVSAGASVLGLGSTSLTFRDNLYTFLPRISAANITPDVEVRVWDPKTARVAVGRNGATTGTAQLSGEKPQALADKFIGPGLPSIPTVQLAPIPGLPKLNFGANPSDTAFVVVDRPLAEGSAADGAASEVAKGLADHIASTFAEAEGTARGDPAIQAGEQVEVKGVPKAFVGKWTVTNARHVFDAQEGGYRTHFTVSGRADRSLLGLASGSATRDRRPRINGLVCGIVTSIKDPDGRGRVKLALPWLSPTYETGWARVANLAAGTRAGAMFLPEVGDEVLVGFEFGDPRRPYVLGGLINDNARFSIMNAAVTGDAVTGRGIASPAGNRLLFTDEVPPGDLPPSKSQITLGTGDGSLGIVIDQVAGTITLNCKPAPPKSRTAAGSVTIDCSGAGKVEVKAGAGGMKIDSEGQLELNGKLGVRLTSNAIVEVQGQLVKIN